MNNFEFFKTIYISSMNGLNATSSTNGYVFEHECVDLGNLQEISLNYVTDDVTEGRFMQ